jgi:hypothetical protein
MVVRLFTSFYPERDSVRRTEIAECLQRNADCTLIDQICLFVEGETSPPVYSPKISQRPVSTRPRYVDFFDWANAVAAADDISIVANSDIFFNATLSALFDVLTENCCAALSRWNVPPDGTAQLYDRADSQDVWVFRGHIKQMVSDFCVGIPRCDNRILHEMQLAGYQVINPAFSIKTFHLHSGDRTEYPAVINGAHVAAPYAYLWPHNLFSLQQTVQWNFSHPSARISWRPDLRRIAAFLPFNLGRRILRSFRLGVANAR